MKMFKITFGNNETGKNRFCFCDAENIVDVDIKHQILLSLTYLHDLDFYDEIDHIEIAEKVL